MSASGRCAQVFLYCEEVEWCLRAIRKCEKLGYAPGAVVLHAQGTATGGGGALKTRSKTAIYLSERNRILLTRDVLTLLSGVCRAAVAASLADKIRQSGRTAAKRIRHLGLAGRTAQRTRQAPMDSKIV